ncbi:uncharacterized protein LOC133038849 [Cannabis sativa]|uniref:uncharacterized protein LOC133038849 n=1 Tax=Cannabis sativa TaxID=3483 RepID=UPI0029CA45F3|nr:uncharacterized protein LOC133038849 [Cannabis sativa]
MEIFQQRQVPRSGPVFNSVSARVQPSGSNVFKIFTDAATDSQRKKHSIGVVLLDGCNRVKAGFSTTFSGLVPPAVAEAKAVHQAIQWAQLLRFPVDVLMTDCKSIVDKLNTCNWNNSVFDDVICSIKNLLSFSPGLTISHVGRDFNLLAHKVARLGLGLDNELIWNGSLPSF